MMQTVGVWGVVNAVKQLPPPCSQLEDLDKTGFLKGITFGEFLLS